MLKATMQRVKSSKKSLKQKRSMNKENKLINKKNYLTVPSLDSLDKHTSRSVHSIVEESNCCHSIYIPVEAELHSPTGKKIRRNGFSISDQLMQKELADTVRERIRGQHLQAIIQF